MASVNLKSFFLFLAFSCLGNIALSQSQPTPEVLYGQGVSAFLAKNYKQAIASFDQVESRGTPDPRAYFYRGLSHFRLDDQNSAAKDFQYASDLELSKAGQSYSVPLALERIQGKERATIEYYRRAARQKWNAEQAKIRKYEFDIQKAKDQKIYNEIIASGSAGKNADTSAAPQINIPFGAKPVDPFGKFETVDTGTQQHTVDLTVTDTNVFKTELDRPIELPSQEKKKPVPKPNTIQDPFSNSDSDTFGQTTPDSTTTSSPFDNAEDNIFQENAGSKNQAVPNVSEGKPINPGQKQAGDKSPSGPLGGAGSPNDFGDFNTDSGAAGSGMPQPQMVISPAALSTVLSPDAKSLGRDFVGLFMKTKPSSAPGAPASPFFETTAPPVIQETPKTPPVTTTPSNTTSSNTTAPSTPNNNAPAQNNATEDPFAGF